MSLRHVDATGEYSSEIPYPRPGFWERQAWILAAVWLVFLAFPIITVWESERPLWLRIVALGAIACFAAVYLYGFITLPDRLSGGASRKAWVLFFVQVALAVVTMFTNPYNLLSFAPFLISFAAYVLGRRTMLIMVILSFVGLALAGWALNDFWELAPLGMAIAIVALMNFMVTELMRNGQRSECMRLELARAEERVTLSRDVHDLLGHSLTVVKLKSELAERLIETDPVRAKQELHEIGAITSEALAGVRATVTGLRRGEMSTELANARTSLEASGHTVKMLGDPSGITPALGVQLAWVIREITTNILRHAHASEVLISWGASSLTVEDDGDGLGAVPLRDDSKGVPLGNGNDNRNESGNGIRGMRERLATVGAKLALSESSLGGAKVEVTW